MPRGIQFAASSSKHSASVPRCSITLHLYLCLRPRWDGNEEGLTELARKNAAAIGAGHRSAAACAGRQTCRPAIQLSKRALAVLQVPVRSQCRHLPNGQLLEAPEKRAFHANIPQCLCLPCRAVQLHHFYARGLSRWAAAAG
jgi:hypothetical protein